MKTTGAALAAIFAASQPVMAATLTDEQRTVVQVFDAPNYGRDQIFTASRQWIAENFRSAKAVIEYESKEDGTIIGNGVIPYPCASGWECLGKPDWKVPFTMRLEAKDGRFRLTFTNISLTWPEKVNAGIKIVGYDGPVNNPKDMEKIKAKLLTFGPEIQQSLAKAKSSGDW